MQICNENNLISQDKIMAIMVKLNLQKTKINRSNLNMFPCTDAFRISHLEEKMNEYFPRNNIRNYEGFKFLSMNLLATLLD